MDTELTSELFECLLAEWAGYGNEPEKAFPNLLNADTKALTNELTETIIKACHVKQAV